MATVYNPTKAPVVIDDEGHVIGGGEHGSTSLTRQVKESLDAGLLIEVSKPPSQKKTDMPPPPKSDGNSKET